MKWCCWEQPQMWVVWDCVILIIFPSGCRKLVPWWVLDWLYSKYSRHIQALLFLQASVQGIVHFNAFKRNKKMSRHRSLTIISSMLSNFGVWIFPSPPWERMRQVLLYLPAKPLCPWTGLQLLTGFLFDWFIWAPTVMISVSKEKIRIRSVSSLNVLFS